MKNHVPSMDVVQEVGAVREARVLGARVDRPVDEVGVVLKVDEQVEYDS